MTQRRGESSEVGEKETSAVGLMVWKVEKLGSGIQMQELLYI